MKDRALVPGRADEKEMTRLMNEHSVALLGVCRAILGDWALAQDVVQELARREGLSGLEEKARRGAEGGQQP